MLRPFNAIPKTATVKKKESHKYSREYHCDIVYDPKPIKLMAV